MLNAANILHFTNKSMIPRSKQEFRRREVCVFPKSRLRKQRRSWRKLNLKNSTQEDQLCRTKEELLEKAPSRVNRKAALRLQSQRWRWLDSNTQLRQWAESRNLIWKELTHPNSMMSCLQAEGHVPRLLMCRMKISRTHRVRTDRRAQHVRDSKWSIQMRFHPWTRSSLLVQTIRAN